VQLGDEPSKRRFAIDQEGDGAAQFVAEECVQSLRVADGAAQIADRRVLVLVDPDEQPWKTG
jgi:hypothetical protein